MKYSLILLSAICAINLSSCKKNTTDTTVPAIPVDSQAYMLSNIQDLTFVNNESLVWEIPVEWKAGFQQKVTVAVSGLPANVTSTPDSVSGLPSFKPTFTLKAKFAEPGVYPISVSATSAALGTKKYDMNLTIKTANDCTDMFLGTYPNTISTRNDTAFGAYTANVSPFGSFKMILSCPSCKAQYSGVKANIDCDKGTFTIPQQIAYTSGPDTNLIKGTGQLLDEGRILIKYSYYTDFYHTWKDYRDTLQ